MNTLPKDRVVGALGVATAIAGALLLVAMTIAADPLGRLIGGLIAASVAFGLVGIATHRVDFPGSLQPRGPRSDPLQPYPEGPLPPYAVRDATACALEDGAAAFAPVISLTEAQVARRRTAPRRREVTAA